MSFLRIPNSSFWLIVFNIGGSFSYLGQESLEINRIYNKIYRIYRYIEYIFIIQELYNIYIGLYAFYFLCTHALAWVFKIRVEQDTVGHLLSGIMMAKQVS